MSLEVQVQEVNSYLLIKGEGRYSLVGLTDLVDRVKAEREKRTHQGVILDVSKIAGTIPLMDMFVLGVHCAKVWGPSFRIALISPDVGIFNFFENVARNRGVQITIVPNQGSALEWLALP
jgi:hypothetical protein